MASSAAWSGVQPQAERRQAEIDEQELNQERRVADRLDVAVCDAAQRGATRGFAQRAQDAHREAEHHGEGRQAHREPRAQQELVELPPDGAELEDIVHARQSAPGGQNTGKGAERQLAPLRLIASSSPLFLMV